MYQSDDDDGLGPEWDEPDDYPREWDEPDDYPRHRVRRALVRAVALVAIIGLLLVFPLGYLLDEELRTQHVEAGLALVELTIAVVLIAVVRLSRRRL